MGDIPVEVVLSIRAQHAEGDRILIVVDEAHLRKVLAETSLSMDFRP